MHRSKQHLYSITSSATASNVGGISTSGIRLPTATFRLHRAGGRTNSSRRRCFSGASTH